MENLTLLEAGSPEAKVHLDAMLQALQAAARLPLVWNAPMIAAIDLAFAAYDAYLTRVVSRHPMACRMRCTACCHDNPQWVTGIELRRLHDVLRATHGADATMARFVALAGQAADPAAWRARGIPCPLLREGECSAYEKRPIACRSFVALTPAEWCSPSHAKYASRVNPHLEPPAILLRFLRMLSTDLGLANAADLHTGMAELG